MSKKEFVQEPEEEKLRDLDSVERSCCGSSPQIIKIHEGVSIRSGVQDYYAARAKDSKACCGDDTQNQLYEANMLTEFPADIANFSLGCGDPITLADLQPGEVVLDLGSGGGLDCFLAAKQVGENGYVIGLDMTPEMLARATTAAQRLGFENVEFRKGYLEEMPVEKHSVDVVISNCVINLSPDKPKVFAEMFRVLRPGGRISVSDIVTNGVLPESVRKDMVAWGACIAGALQTDEYITGLEAAGFERVQLTPKAGDGELLSVIPDPGIFSASITARKPVS